MNPLLSAYLLGACPCSKTTRAVPQTGGGNVQRETKLLPGTEEEKESRALPESLMDEVQVGGAADGESLIRMVKRKAVAEA